MPNEPQQPDKTTPSESQRSQVEHPPDSKEKAVPFSPQCSATAPQYPEQFVFAIGKLDVRFPSIGLEREFHRCAKMSGGLASLPRGERLRKVFEANHHLAPRVAYLLCIAGVPAFVLTPTTPQARATILESLSQIDSSDHWVLIVGRQGPMCGPSDCGGLLVPMVACDQIYTFSVAEWSKNLEDVLKPALQAKKTDPATLSRSAIELFNQMVSSMQNIGATDPHRALNFVLMRHPGLFLAVAERAAKASFDKVETRAIHGLGTRRVLAVILTFRDLATGVPERVFCRIDVTEEWPFLSDQPDGSPAPLGLLPFIENDLMGAAF